MNRLDYYLIKLAYTQLTPAQRAARYPHVADLQRRMTVGPGNSAEQAQQNYTDIYTKRYNNIANPNQIGRWYANGKTDQQIYDYTHGQVMKSMARDGLYYPSSAGSFSFVSPFAPAQPATTSYASSTSSTGSPYTYTPTSYESKYTPATPNTPYLAGGSSSSYTAPSSTGSRGMFFPPASTTTSYSSSSSTSTPASTTTSSYTPTYGAPPVRTTIEDSPYHTSSRWSMKIPAIAMNPYYTGPTRNAAGIRAANKDMSNNFRSPNFTWDKNTGKYNWTGGTSRMDQYKASRMELARLHNIWNNMNREERGKYTNIFNARTKALRAYGLSTMK